MSVFDGLDYEAMLKIDASIGKIAREHGGSVVSQGSRRIS